MKMTNTECLNKIAQLTEELDIADVTKEEALEALKDASFNEIAEGNNAEECCGLLNRRIADLKAKSEEV